MSLSAPEQELRLRTGDQTVRLAAALRARIVDGTLKPGAPLRQEQIAEKYSVSRMPVREALRQLDSEGLVILRPNRGAVVTQLTAGDVEELFEMRAVFEALAARRALDNLDGAALDELEHLCARMDRSRGDARSWIEHHHQFHNYLCGRSARPRLIAEIDRLRRAVQPYLLMYISVYGTTEMQGFEHEALMAAVRRGDPRRLEDAMREHILSAAHGVIEFVKRQGPDAADRPAAPRARRRSA